MESLRLCPLCEDGICNPQSTEDDSIAMIEQTETSGGTMTAKAG